MHVLIVDDHSLIRDALVAVVMEAAPGAIVAQAGTCSAARAHLCADPATDLVIVDLALPDGSGLDLLAEIRSRQPATGIVVLSANPDRSVMAASLDAGATGFIPKSASRAIILGALRIVLAGGIYIPAEVWPPPTAPAPAPRSPRDMGRSSARGPGPDGGGHEQQGNGAQVQNRTEAAMAASRLGWLLPPAR